MAERARRTRRHGVLLARTLDEMRSAAPTNLIELADAHVQPTVMAGFIERPFRVEELQACLTSLSDE